jgi:hypothetical protein
LSINGYSDWHLPTKDELNEIDVYLIQPVAGALLNGCYWSSTSYNAGFLRMCFSSGKKGSLYDYYPREVYNVRAVRSY